MGITGSVPIGFASNLTGVSPSTIRAWERRYGVPTPKRSRTGRRTYDDRAIQQINGMVRLVSTGLPPSLAAQQVLLDEPPSRLISPEISSPTPEVSLRLLLESVANFDGDGLGHQLKRHALALPSGQFLSRIIIPLMKHLNTRWTPNNPIHRAQEYVSTEAIRKVLHELADIVRPKRTRGCALIAPFHNDVHELPLDALAFMLSTHGFQIVQLGPLTSPDVLGAVIEHVEPALIALSASNRPESSEVAPLLSAYQAVCTPRPWIVGGHAANALSQELEAHGAKVVLDESELECYLESLSS